MCPMRANDIADMGCSVDGVVCCMSGAAAEKEWTTEAQFGNFEPALHTVLS